MSKSISYDRRFNPDDAWRQALAIGASGGLAEVAVVALYGAATGHSASAVAAGVSEAVGLPHSAVAGFLVHMLLSFGLGAVLARVLARVFKGEMRPLALYAGLPVVLAAIWAFNFFVLLPWLSPSFVHMLPYGVSLFSKLMFGLSAAIAVHLQSTSGMGTARHPGQALA
ncbi:hypothetical protein CAL29_23935 [Bordetella genomosp. 10]|uniref:Uncharacterized protein n=1 Tax=Bordetella genomosp. 10 TaxID=1416804 RepID=A0A261S3F3_9BORD|nr:hypothetical protein [Bordetella genomosp. 10]OZI31003.1 hypothetical protein CAL29_23935 [Bordetella genomosp. 10]